jgi:hypothetical protein
MPKNKQLQHRIKVLTLVFEYVENRSSTRYSAPSYEEVVNWLNSLQTSTSTGNDWTRKRLFRFLQNAGYCGLHGVKNNRKNQSTHLTPEDRKGISLVHKERES